MKRRIQSLVLALLGTLFPLFSIAGVTTPHLISFQGRAVDSGGDPVASGDVSIRVYDAIAGGNLVYDSGSEFAGRIVDGIFDVLLGSGAPLLLDNTRLYYLELEVNGQEVIGDTAAGRRPFYPGGGSHERTDLEDRIATLENIVFYDCEPGTFDLNQNPADQCEFMLDPQGIYVDQNDPDADDLTGCGRGPTGTGTDCRPCRSIAAGLREAVSATRTTVYVAGGTYEESVDLTVGISLLGGFRSGTWERSIVSVASTIMGTSGTGHRKTIAGLNLTTPTTVEGFVILGNDATEPGRNSYAVWLRNCGALTLRSNTIIAGSGAQGSDGAAGSTGMAGINGAAGAPAFVTTSSSCSGVTQPGGSAGQRLCGGTSVSGGSGGGSACPVVLDSQAGSGSPGSGSSPGSGGAGGWNGRYSGSTCYLPSGGPMAGTGGTSGGNGSNGGAGSGASNPYGTVASGEWSGGTGGAGVGGTNGSGGGGGGCGGGRDGISPNLDALGGAGGGGGSGGCGGAGGTGGSGGGGSFAVFVAEGAAPVIQTNRIFVGSGGVGGRGGAGGVGGIGGLGGAAGGVGSVFCVGMGGAGGDGGNGGHAGGSGGGAGGVAFGIFTSGVSGVPAYCTMNTVTGGVGGAGGAGGVSCGNPGSAGTNGATAGCRNQ